MYTDDTKKKPGKRRKLQSANMKEKSNPAKRAPKTAQSEKGNDEGSPNIQHDIQGMCTWLET